MMTENEAKGVYALKASESVFEARAAKAEARVAELEWDVERWKNDYGEACKLVAEMHAAAVGEVTGPNRGVVEDVADMAARANAGAELIDALGGCDRCGGTPFNHTAECDSGGEG